jgi:hypothetical protein
MDECSLLRVNFRFANDIHYHQLPLAVPCTVGDVRDHLKSTLNITTPLDVVVYSVSVETDTENSILFDSERLLGGARCLVKRVPESLAKILLQHATMEHSEASTLSNGASNDSSLVREEVIGNVYTNSVIFPKRIGNNLTQTAMSTRLPFNNKRIKVVQTASLHETTEREKLDSNGSDLTLNTNDNSFERRSDISSLDGKSVSPKTLSVSENLLETENGVNQGSGLNAQKSFESTAQGQRSCDEEISQRISHGDDEDEEDERERILLRKVAEEHENHLGPYTKSVAARKVFTSGEKNYFQEKFNRSNAVRNHRGYSGKRFFRNCNLTWTKQNEQKTTAETCSTPLPFPSNRNVGRQVNTLKSSHFCLPKTIIPVNENYLCHICGEKGHHIRNCLKGNDPKQQKKVKPATGVPRSWLRRIPQDQVAMVNGDVYCLPGDVY